jgi:esterase/lipase superfamily enzyme
MALSGLYRLDRQEFGLTGDDLPAVYFNSPLSYLPELTDERYLASYCSSRIVVWVGQGAWEDAAIATPDTWRHSWLKSTFQRGSITGETMSTMTGPGGTSR